MDPAESQLSVQAIVEVPAERAGQPVDFLLTSRLKISDANVPVATMETGVKSGFQGINGSSLELAQRAGITRYRVELPPGSTRLELTYAGPVSYTHLRAHET